MDNLVNAFGKVSGAENEHYCMGQLNYAEVKLQVEMIKILLKPQDHSDLLQRLLHELI